MHELLAKFAEQLKERACKKIYLTHDPFQEKDARIFAEALEQLGFTVVVAADVRSYGVAPRDVSDFEPVKKAAQSCDAVVIFTKAYSRFIN